MIEIGIQKITKSYGFKNILNDISFELKTNEIIGLVGDNGCGKTTLLNIIAGKESVDSGSVSLRKNSKIGYLEQIPNLTTNQTVKELLYDSVKEIFNIENKLHEYELKLASGIDIDKTLKKYGNLQEQYINMGGYEVNNKINKIINGFKIEHLLSTNYNNLSGGEKRLVLLASMMIKEPNILLLDEPTNHLDIDTLEWFEDYLKKYNGTVLIVSHDRYFLDKVATKIILIERGKEHIFFGNYSNYLKENEERLDKELKEYKDQQKIIIELKKKIKQLEEWGKLAYPGGDPFFRRAENIRKRLERIELKDKPLPKKELPLNFDFDTRSGKDVITINNLDLKVQDRLLIKDINIKINYKDRVCIMGNNGTGKSTLIKEILNSPNVKIGSNVKIGYIPQEIDFNEDIRVIDYARRYFIGEEQYLRSALYKFNFCFDNVYKKINKLSGGEKIRLKLFELIQSQNNLLILDEPTNHIDITTKEVLESSLSTFNGTILFISHDRYFINKIANKILYIKNETIKEYIGNYNDLKSK